VRQLPPATSYLQITETLPAGPIRDGGMAKRNGQRVLRKAPVTSASRGARRRERNV
jgi:hypothetical protein